MPDASSQEEQAPLRDEHDASEVKEEIVEEEGQEHELPPLGNVDDAESLYKDTSEPEVAVPYNLNQREPKRFAKLRHGHTFHPRLATPSVLDEDWSNVYENCPIFSQIWNEIHGDPEIWPQGIKLFNGKIYREEKLCIPTGLAMRIVGVQHIFGGHLGVEKLVRSLRLRYEFAETTSLWTMAKEIKAMCNTCQACEHPHWKIAGKIEMTPIPPKIMTSVSMDLFSPPITTWQGTQYDSLALCVDRHSGWIIAVPTQKLGLTAEKLGHLMIEHGWNIFGVPSIITNDQGPQYVGPWWQTICARLGVRNAYSQAHTPQSNGRAEMKLEFPMKFQMNAKVENLFQSHI